VSLHQCQRARAWSRLRDRVAWKDGVSEGIAAFSLSSVLLKRRCLTRQQALRLNQRQKSGGYSKRGQIPPRDVRAVLPPVCRLIRDHTALAVKNKHQSLPAAVCSAVRSRYPFWRAALQRVIRCTAIGYEQGGHAFSTHTAQAPFNRNVSSLHRVLRSCRDLAPRDSHHPVIRSNAHNVSGRTIDEWIHLPSRIRSGRGRRRFYSFRCVFGVDAPPKSIPIAFSNGPLARILVGHRSICAGG
jgi:hypothetical protein